MRQPADEHKVGLWATGLFPSFSDVRSDTKHKPAFTIASFIVAC
ncbi:MAG: hypothetical protein V2G42_04265 [bacterium JZ-2024 1]